MHIKPQTSSTAGGNAGSCRHLVEYLEKEDREKKPDQREYFFSHTQDRVYPEKVIEAIDNNRGQLGKEDAKFYELYISPSEPELAHLSNDPGKLREYVREQVMSAYSAGFGPRKGRELKPEDLVYFGKIEYHRRYKGTDPQVQQGEKKSGELKEGFNMHVHVLVSRKDVTNTIKLSPMANERGGEGTAKLNGKAVQRGFDRVAFKQRCEEGFDERFGYARRLEESFAYQNALQNGTAQDRSQASQQHQAKIREREARQLAQQLTQVEQAKQPEITPTQERQPVQIRQRGIGRDRDGGLSL